jgi:hypothetical protein
VNKIKGKKGKYLVAALSILFLYFIFLPSVVAINYNVEASDPMGDVVLMDHGIVSGYANADLVYASTNEKGNDVIFTIRVRGDIDKSLRCRFHNEIFSSQGGGIWTDIYFNGIVQGYHQVGKIGGGQIKNASYEISRDTLKMTVPKKFFGNITNWIICVYVDEKSAGGGWYADMIYSNQFHEISRNGNGSGNASVPGNAGDVPGFDAISIGTVVAILFIFTIFKKQVRI